METPREKGLRPGDAADQHPLALKGRTAIAATLAALILAACALGQELSSTNPEALNRYGRGMDRLKVSDWAGAAAEFTAAIDIDPNFAEAHFRLGQARMKMKFFTEAQSCFEKALQLKPDLLPAKMGLVAVLIEEKKLDRAEREARQLIRKAPDRPEPYFFLGQIFTHRGREEKEGKKRLALLDQAVLYFRRAAEAAPAEAGIRFALGGALLRSGRPSQAARELEEAVRLNRTDPVYNRQFGEVCLILGRYFEAQQHLLLASRDPKQRNTDLYLLLMQAYRYLGDYHQAAIWGALAQKNDPTNPRLFLYNGIIHRLLGNYSLAEGLIRQALQYDPDLPEADYELGMIYFERREWRGAVEFLRKATQRDPDDYRAWYHLALALRCLGRNSESDQAFAKFKELKDAEQARREASGVEMGPRDRPMPTTTQPTPAGRENA